MEIISGKTTFSCEGNSAVAIGKFDGVHLGHRKLLEQILHRKLNGEKAVVFTFEPSPSRYLAEKKGLPYDEKEITTRDEKRQIFSDLGVDLLVEFPMNDQTAIIEPEDFIRTYLSEYLQVKYIAAGKDLSFGNKGTGDWKLLQSLSKELGYEADIIEKVCYQGIEVSSTYVRDCLLKGQVTSMPELLGRYYTVSGIVSHGHKIGRTIGMPTVNLLPPDNKLLPAYGVYYSKVLVNGVWFNSITNIGKKPSISRKEAVGVETYIYDFNKEIYGCDITVSLLEYKRPELYFAEFGELIIKMQEDLEQGRRYHNDMRQ